MSVKSGLVNSMHRFLDRRGFALVRLRNKFGLDPFSDIQQLAHAWGHPITVVFDVGANNGSTAITALKKFPRAQVLSFEPHPSTFARLIARVGTNPRFRGVNLAFSSSIGEVEMTEYDS